MYPYEHTMLWNVKKYVFWVGNGHQEGAKLQLKETLSRMTCIPLINLLSSKRPWTILTSQKEQPFAAQTNIPDVILRKFHGS